MAPKDPNSWYIHPCVIFSRVCAGPNDPLLMNRKVMGCHFWDYITKTKSSHKETMVGCWPRANTKNWDVQPATEKELNAANTRVRELEADLPQDLQMRPQPWWTGWMLNWDPEPEHPAVLYSDSWSTKDNICCFKPLKFWGNLSYSASGWTVSPSKFRC